MPATVKEKGAKQQERYFDAMASLDGVEAVWGILDTAQNYDDGTSVHMVTAVHIYGIPSDEIPNGQTIPQRDFLGGSFDKRFTDYEVLADLAIDGVVAGQGPIEAMTSIAAKGASDAKKDLLGLSYASLAASTIRQKGHDKPLVRTRHLFSQIDYKGRKDG